MNYSSDKPIEHADQDILGRTTFSKQLGKAINEYDCKDGLVIGVFGKWGTGKTSIINMALEELDSANKDGKQRTIVVNFNPWNYSDRNNLIRLFFARLKAGLGIKDKKSKIGMCLDKYSDALDALSLIPYVGTGIAAVSKAVLREQGKRLENAGELDTIKNELEKLLAEKNQKFVVVIDDVDRLTNTQICDMVQLVKKVANFSNIIYILSMDREVVSRALEEIHKCDGNEYLEKIVQIPIEIPEIKSTKLNNILFSELDNVINNISHKIELDINYWDEIFRKCVKPYINTLRDVNRVINTFAFRFSVLYQETALEDLIGITTIEVLEPKLYKWIFDNKDALCVGISHAFEKSLNKTIDYKERYKKEFERLGIDVEKSFESVAALFPIFAEDVDKHSYYSKSTEAKKKMRIADEKRFELYFGFNLDDVKVPRTIISSFMFDYDMKEMNDILKICNDNGTIVYFIEELRSLVEEMPPERLEIIALSIINFEEEYKGEQTNSIFSFSARNLAEYYVGDILRRIDTDEKRFELLKKAVESANKYSLNIVAYELYLIESAYDRTNAKSESKKDQIITIDQLLALEKKYVEKVENIVNQGNEFEITGFNYIIYLWRVIDESGAINYVKQIIKDDIKKIKFICGLASSWSGTNGKGWSFSRRTYEEYASEDEIYKTIKELAKSRLSDFSELEQIQMASFILDYKKDEMEQANEQKAKGLVAEWNSNTLKKE